MEIGFIIIMLCLVSTGSAVGNGNVKQPNRRMNYEL